MLPPVEIGTTQHRGKLMLTPPIQLSREDLLNAGWGYKGQMETRTVDNFIVRLRKYFEEDNKKPRYFKSVRGKGYMLVCREI